MSPPRKESIVGCVVVRRTRADRSHPSATVARLAIPRLRCTEPTNQTVPCRSRRLSPGPCPSGVGHPGHQSPRRSRCPSGPNFFGQRRLAGLHLVLAHNLYRWTERHTSRSVGQLTNDGTPCRTRLFRLPGRIVNHGGKLILRLPARWPWADTYLTTRPASQPPPTLLIHPEASTKTGRKHPPTGSARPYTLQIRPDTPNQTRQTSQQPHAPAKNPLQPLPRIPNHPHHPPTQIKTVDSS